MNTKPSPKRCACCGADAGRWQQWHNQDTGYGLCRACADRIATHQPFGRPGELNDPAAFCRTYGLPGIHYEPRYVRHYGMEYGIAAEFADNQEGADKANAFMLQHSGVGLLLIEGGRIYLAHLDDMGRAPLAAAA